MDSKIAEFIDKCIFPETLSAEPVAEGNLYIYTSTLINPSLHIDNCAVCIPFEDAKHICELFTMHGKIFTNEDLPPAVRAYYYRVPVFVEFCVYNNLTDEFIEYLDRKGLLDVSFAEMYTYEADTDKISDMEIETDGTVKVENWQAYITSAHIIFEGREANTELPVVITILGSDLCYVLGELQPAK